MSVFIGLSCQVSVGHVRSIHSCLLNKESKPTPIIRWVICPAYIQKNSLNTSPLSTIDGMELVIFPNTSIPDLTRQVTDDAPIPSESTVLKNALAKSSKLYKWNIPLQKVQTRQLRSSHIDQHYCNAIFKYIRHVALLNRDKVSFLC